MNRPTVVRALRIGALSIALGMLASGVFAQQPAPDAAIDGPLDVPPADTRDLGPGAARRDAAPARARSAH